MPSFAFASSLALGLLYAADVCFVAGPRPPLAIVSMACLALAFGVAHGACWSGAQRLLRRLPSWSHWLLWPGVGLGAGLLLARRLGAFTRLSGPYRTLAIEVLCAGAVGGLGLGVIAAALQPSGQGRPRLLRSGVWKRLALALLLMLGAAGVFVIDHVRYVGLYPAAHAGLRWTSLWATMFAIALVASALRLPRVPRAIGLGLLVLLVGLPVALIGPERAAELYAINQRPWSSDLLRVGQRLLDFDGDGYAAGLGGGDCDNFNASVHPGAREIPDNGRDDNCVLGDGTRRTTPVDRIAAASEPSPLDVVLITIEALRPDHIGTFNPAYGPKGRNTTPYLDAWARDAVVFKNAFAPGAWTIISLSALMRGSYARRLKWDPFYETDRFRLLPATDKPELAEGEKLLHFFPIPATDAHVTMAELLQRRGMRTMAVVDDGFSAMLQPGNGLSRGFERYYYSTETSDNPDPVSVKRARRALSKVNDREHYFMWVHLFGTHFPNEVHPEVPSYGPSMADGYDHELRYIDLQLRELLAALDKREPRPVVIVTGDHGETIAPWMRSHGFGLDEPTMRVPLFIRVPGVPGRMVDATVSLVDLFPTVMALTKTPGPAQLDGFDLMPVMKGGAGVQPRFVLTDCWRYAPDRKPYLDIVGASDGKRVIFYDLGTGVMSFPGAPGMPGYALPARSALSDPLALFTLGYTEEIGSVP